MKTERTKRKGVKGLIIALLLAISMIVNAIAPSFVIAGTSGYAWTHGDWSSRVAWEARKALSKSANGISAWPVRNYWLGDWNYVADDWYAYTMAAKEASDIGPVSDIDNHHRGGWCTFFVRLILYRATYWAGYGEHLTTPNYPNSVYSWMDTRHMTQDFSSVKPGWILMTTSTPHYAIADERASIGGQWGWWIIDSNFVENNGSYKYYIGKHFMSDGTLRANSYWAWLPSQATKN